MKALLEGFYLLCSIKQSRVQWARLFIEFVDG
jgi:hypothetical protein